MGGTLSSRVAILHESTQQVRAQSRKGCHRGIQHPCHDAQAAAQRRQQCDGPELAAKRGEQRPHHGFAHLAHVWVARVVIAKVVPEEDASGLSTLSISAATLRAITLSRIELNTVYAST